MKKSLLVLALILGLGLSATAEARMWMVGSLSGAGGVGLRGELGKEMVWDLSTTYVGSAMGATNIANTMPVYFDIYKGNWGVGLNSVDLGKGVTNVTLQYAIENWVNKDVGFGVAVNVIQYSNSGDSVVSSTGSSVFGGTPVGARTVSLFSGLNAYVLLGFDAF